MRTKGGPTFEMRGTFLNETGSAGPCLPLAKRYVCLYCDAVFGLKLYLNLHYDEKHGKAIPDFADYALFRS